MKSAWPNSAAYKVGPSAPSPSSSSSTSHEPGPSMPSSSTSNDGGFVPRQLRRSSLPPAVPSGSAPQLQHGLSLNAARAGGTAPLGQRPTSPSSSMAAPAVTPLKLPARPSPIAAAPAATSPTTAPSPTTSTIKRANPLEDLIYTEQTYVDDLGMVIKRVAAAWSPTNLPPPALVTIFRSMHAIYKTNELFLTRLIEIGPNPSSPRALGDLLMRWVDDLAPSYTDYSRAYSTDFDLFTPVQMNAQLVPLLQQLPWPDTLDDDDELSDATNLTLDALFSLPHIRLKYYKKLYAKLLRSAVVGGLLVDANVKLDALLESYAKARKTSVVVLHGGAEPTEEARRRARRMTPPTDSSASTSTSANTSANTSAGNTATAPNGLRSSGESGTVNSSFDSSARSSAVTVQSSVTDGSNKTHTPAMTVSEGPASPRIQDLERILNTSRALDIFTMLPKKCKLQMAPPSLPFTRSVRRSGDVALSLYPRSDPRGNKVVVDCAYLILLTDLFLVCQRMTSQERMANVGSDGDGPEFWLVYPPLAGKHLRVVRAQTAEHTLEITVMKKETLIVRFSDGRALDEWKESFEDAIAFGAAQPSSAARSNSVASSRANAAPSSSVPPVLSPTAPYSPLSLGNMPGALPEKSWDELHPLPVRTPVNYQHEFFPQPRGSLSTNASYAASPSAVPSFVPPSSSPPTDRRLPALNKLTIDTSRWLNASGSQPDRRAFSAGPHPGSPASMGPLNGYASPQYAQPFSASPRPYGLPGSAASSNSIACSVSPSPQSAAFQSSNGNRGPSPSQPGSAMSYSERQSPFGAPSQNGNPNEYGPGSQRSALPPLPPSGIPERLVKSSSSRSNGSSASSGTVYSSNHHEIPPVPSSARSSANDSFGGDGRFNMGRSQDSYRSAETFGRGGTLGPPSQLIHRSRSADGLRDPREYRPSAYAASSAPGSSYNGYDGRRHERNSMDFDDDADDDDEDATSAIERARKEQTSVIAQMRCKVFLQHGHGQWKSLGTAKLKLFLSKPSLTKQLVVDSDKNKTIISTIVLTDGVERVGKTGVAIKLSNQGEKTGIVYMLQMKTEQSCVGLFDQLLIGSDRAPSAKRR
ncbi:BQ2448_4977 [Microbotryum intermedium]|uniref:BQ2448_4977 protein n=1 Tax=Microbotryum intermedium TaxID=269621 RepID=A0A238FJV0_9BASI|nr:BQ2448_4977 [Microbotryum intermedium]